MGRSVEIGGDVLASYVVWMSEDYVSVCRFCEDEVKVSGYGPLGAEWELAYPKDGMDANDAILCVTDPAENDYDDGVIHEGWEYDSDNWTNDVEFYTERLQELFPSLYAADGSGSAWYLRETSVILRNALVEVRVSEYAGATAFSFAPVEGLDYDGRTGLAAKWVAQIEPKLGALFGK